MVDLDSDEQETGGDRGGACGSCEGGGGDGHVRLPESGGSRGGRRAAMSQYSSTVTLD
jgi:hypothetical protein